MCSGSGSKWKVFSTPFSRSVCFSVMRPRGPLKVASSTKAFLPRSICSAVMKSRSASCFTERRFRALCCRLGAAMVLGEAAAMSTRCEEGRRLNREDELEQKGEGMGGGGLWMRVAKGGGSRRRRQQAAAACNATHGMKRRPAGDVVE